jgi:hypothetical protein
MGRGHKAYSLNLAEKEEDEGLFCWHCLFLFSETRLFSQDTSKVCNLELSFFNRNAHEESITSTATSNCLLSRLLLSIHPFQNRSSNNPEPEEQ